MKFLKKRDDLNIEVKPLSEEQIQKKLYGTYKPGTLGKVVKIENEVSNAGSLEQEKQEKPQSQEPDLFSQFDDEPKIIEKAEEKEQNEEDDLREKIHESLMQYETSESLPKKKSNPEVIKPTVDQELYELNLSSKDDKKSSSDDATFESLKLTLIEIFEKLKEVDVKYVVLSLFVFIGIFFIFNILSSTSSDKEISSLVSEEITQKSTLSDDPAINNDGSVSDNLIKVKEEVPVIKLDESSSVTVSEKRDVLVAPITTTASSEQSNVSVDEGMGEFLEPPYYTIQVAVSNDLKATEKLISTFKSAGLKAFYREVYNSRGSLNYYIHIDQYKTRSDANEALASYKKMKELRRYSDSYVTKVSS